MNDMFNIQNGVLKSCDEYIKVAKIPDNVTAIDDEAFLDCIYLKHVVISENVDIIGEKAFSRCTSLESVIIESNPFNSITILSEAFSLCRALKSISLPPFAGVIGPAAFLGCTSLTKIDIPSRSMAHALVYGGTAHIEAYTFAYCTSLRSITIPNTIKEIDDEAFTNCYSLEDVYFGGTEEQWDRMRIGKYKNDAIFNANIHIGDRIFTYN